MSHCLQCTTWCMTWQDQSWMIKFWMLANKTILGDEAAVPMHCSLIVASHWGYP
uniref:Uncharacterized protein n=1 Tax=Arundo donax TaxID=35708 RepID=A0A0A9BSX9_ARUDO